MEAKVGKICGDRRSSKGIDSVDEGKTFKQSFERLFIPATGLEDHHMVPPIDLLEESPHAAEVFVGGPERTRCLKEENLCLEGCSNRDQRFGVGS